MVQLVLVSDRLQKHTTHILISHSNRRSMVEVVSLRRQASHHHLLVFQDKPVSVNIHKVRGSPPVLQEIIRSGITRSSVKCYFYQTV